MVWPSAADRRKRCLEIALCLLVLGLALFLRLRRIDTTGIWGDQSFTLNTAMGWVNGGPIPLAANKSSVGFVNPPMIEYLYAAALRIWPDILSVAMLTMISGMIALAAAGWCGYRVFGKRAAFWTMLIMAVNPWSVLYSQLIWNQTMVPVFSALTIVCLVLYFAVGPRSVYLILSFACAACMTQVHPGSSVQLVTMAVILVIFRRKLRVWPLLAGIAVFALFYVPYLLYESGVGWSDLRIMLDIGRQPASISAAAILVSIDLLHAEGVYGAVKGVTQFDGLATVMLALSLVFALWMVIRGLAGRRDDPPANRETAGWLILILWFALPILLYLRSATYLQAYYLISQFPAHFLLIGAGASGIQRYLEQNGLRTGRRAGRLAVWAGPALLLALAGWQFGFNLQYQDHRKEAQGGEAVQIRHTRAQIDQVRRLLDERPDCKLVVVSEGHSLETSNLSLLREFTYPKRVLLTDGRLAVPIPSPCAVYLDALPGSRASNWLAGAAAPLQEEATIMPGKTWRFLDLPASARASWPAERLSQVSLAEWTNGVALTEYTRGQVHTGAVVPVTLTWSIQTPPPEAVYHFGTYLLTMDNQVVAQSDGPGFDSIQWAAGDDFITWFDLATPPNLSPGSYRFAVALYTWPYLERVPLTSGENTAFPEQVQLPAAAE